MFAGSVDKDWEEAVQQLENQVLVQSEIKMIGKWVSHYYLPWMVRSDMAIQHKKCAILCLNLITDSVFLLHQGSNTSSRLFHDFKDLFPNFYTYFLTLPAGGPGHRLTCCSNPDTWHLLTLPAVGPGHRLTCCSNPDTWHLLTLPAVGPGYRLTCCSNPDTWHLLTLPAVGPGHRLTCCSNPDTWHLLTLPAVGPGHRLTCCSNPDTWHLLTLPAVGPGHRLTCCSSCCRAARWGRRTCPSCPDSVPYCIRSPTSGAPETTVLK